MKPFILAMIISVTLIVLIVIFEPAKFFYHNMDCTGGIGGGCDRNTAKYIYNLWNSIMDANWNPLRHIKDMQVRHLVLQLLAWMWCITFSLYFGSFVVFGYTAVAHFMIIIAVVVTVVTFKKAEDFKNTTENA